MRSADYVKATTTSIAGSSGDGAVTLIRSTGFPLPSETFGTTKRWVRYIINDTTNTKFEEGIGSITSDVLTRTKVQVTWDGATWKDGSANVAAAALQFGSSPTSGNVIIRLGPTAEDRFPIINVRQSTVTGDANWRDYEMSGHMNIANAGGGVALTAGRQYFAAVRIETAGLLSGVQLEVTTLQAASHIRLGLYDIGSAGLPDSLISTFNIVDSSTTGVKTDTTISTWTPTYGVWLTPGWYAVGILSDSTPSIRCAPGGTAGQARGPFCKFDTYGHSYCLFVTQAYASGLQATYGGSGTLLSNPAANNLNNPWVGLKVVA